MNLFRHPRTGKVIDLRLYTAPSDDEARDPPQQLLAPMGVYRPVAITRIGQLLFLFIGGRYVDSFLAPSPQCGVVLSRDQRERIAAALLV